MMMMPLPTVIMNTSTVQQQYTQPASITTCNNNRAFNEFFLQIFTNFFNLGKFVKIREFFC